MEKLLLAGLFTISMMIVRAQTNLLFNKVITNTGTLNFTSNSSATWTVPDGKVWKIESMTTNQQFISYSAAVYMYFNLNSIRIKQFNSLNASGSLTSQIENLSPLWLKSGDSIQFTSNANLSANYSCNYYISILEFNLAP